MQEADTPETKGPCHRTMIGIDVEGSTGRPDAEKVEIRKVLYAIVEHASRLTGITETARERYEYRGDGLIILVRPRNELPKNLMPSVFVPELKRLLTDHNKANPGLAFRIRVAVHAGEVNGDDRGWSGQAFDLTCRLLDARRVKQQLRKIVAPAVLVVSDDFYRSVICHGYEGIDRTSYQPVVKVKVGERRHQGWILMDEHMLAG
jgi:hypothetical protein